MHKLHIYSTRFLSIQHGSLAPAAGAVTAIVLIIRVIWILVLLGSTVRAPALVIRVRCILRLIGVRRGLYIVGALSCVRRVSICLRFWRRRRIGCGKATGERRQSRGRGRCRGCNRRSWACSASNWTLHHTCDGVRVQARHKRLQLCVVKHRGRCSDGSNCGLGTNRRGRGRSSWSGGCVEWRSALYLRGRNVRSCSRRRPLYWRSDGWCRGEEDGDNDRLRSCFGKQRPELAQDRGDRVTRP